jgi:pimeloyl-ACP methyl ester carboxylesterase
LSDLTFESICADARAVLDHFAPTLFSGRFAVFGSRIGALVASALANSHPADAVALWEPVGIPNRFFEEGGRSRRLSNLARTDGEEGETWREELARAGVLDLVGFSVYPPLVSSLDSLDMESLRLPPSPRAMVVDFGGSRKQVSAWLSQQDPTTTVDVLKIGMAESWWFQDDHMRRGAEEVIAATVDWIANALGESQR